MGKRGRPKHPDILTPREWEVLDLLRDGLSNEEIAQRLRISVAGAKYHVSEILSKLAVASREEAAAWQPERRRWPLAAFAPLGFWRRADVPWLSTAAAGLAGAAVVAGIALLVWGLVRTSGDGDGNGQLASDGALSPPAQPLRPEDVPFEIVGPFDANLPISQDIVENIGSWFVLDVQNQELYIIGRRDSTADRRGPTVRAVGWLPDDALFVHTEERDYRATLTGEIFASGPFLVTPRDRNERLSADGEWYARHEGGQYGAILVGRPDEDPSYRLTNGWTDWGAGPPAWSPQGSTLAFTGSLCLGWDLFVFDPEEAQLRVLSEVGTQNQLFLDFVWHPDGRTLAVNMFPSISLGLPASIGLIDAETGARQQAVELSMSGWLDPLGWSPSGDYLLIQFIGGGGACEDVGTGGVPTPEETRLEILTD